MKILFDECVPKRLRRFLAGFDVTTVPEAGWAGVKNGDLLLRAARDFNVFITVDRNVSFQQNPESLLPIIIIHSKSNRLKDLEPLVAQLVAILKEPLAVTIHHVGTS